MKIKAIFFQNTKWYMPFSSIIQFASRKVYKLNKKDFITNHVGMVINDVYFESRLFGNWSVEKYDINFKNKILKSNIVKCIDIKVKGIEKVELQKAKDRVKKKYSILKSLAAFDCKQILGNKFGGYLNKLFDYLARNKKDYEFCIEYFIELFLSIVNKEEKKYFISAYIEFIKKTYNNHPITKEIKMVGVENLTVEFVAKESIPLDFYMFLLSLGYKSYDVVL